MTRPNIYTAPVTFERTERANDVLPEEAQGAVGYMAISAADEDGVRYALQDELNEVGLRLLEVDQIQEVDLNNLPADIDEHLLENIKNWQAGRRTVWGTIHVYLGDGEA